MSDYRKKILVNLLILILGIILIFSLFLIFSVRKSMLSDAKERLILSSEKNAELFNTKLTIIQNTVDNLTIVTEQILNNTKSAHELSAYKSVFEEELGDILYRTGQTVPGLKTLYIYFNPDYFGFYHNISYAYLEDDRFERLRILPQEAYHSDDPDMAWFYKPLEGGEGLWIEPYYWDIFNTRIITYAKPALSDDAAFGVIGLDLTVEELIDELESFRIFESGTAFLLNEEMDYITGEGYRVGEHFFSTGIGEEFNEQDFEDQKIKGLTGILESANYLLSYSRLNNGWIMAVKAPKSEIFLPIRDFIVYVLLLTVFFIILSILIARRTAGFLSTPLEKIARNISHFDLNRKASLVRTGITELDSISQNFKTMADSVSRSYEIIKEKNVELEEAYREVEDSYKEIESLAGNLEGIMNLTSSISVMAVKNEPDYLKQILKTTMTLLKKADMGIILKYDKHQWINVYHSEFSEETVQFIRERLNDTDAHLLIEQIEEKKKDYMYLYSPLKYGDRLLGAIVIGNRQNENLPFSSEDRIILKAFSNLAASFFGIQQLLTSKTKFRESILLSMIKLVELHDPYTKGHSESVSRLSVQIAQKMELGEREISTIKWAGLVHDIGKILIPKEILNKPDKLNPDEYAIIRKHPEYGAKVLSEAEEISEVANIVKYHHERWDGTGYPDGFAGQAIPLESRIISVADTYDAMISDRPYRKGLAHEIAKIEIVKHSGIQFDPKVVEAFLRLIN
ncbi:MAG TPA: HD domain-containing protein [Thermotogota bacterium]|nr:HD domain-containing protein [Thermotogota bacterium]HPR97101.1 HD domain-containing protein [Thermotogota bacterium]